MKRKFAAVHIVILKNLNAFRTKKNPSNATPPFPSVRRISFRPHAAHWPSIASLAASSTVCRANDCRKGLSYSLRPPGKPNNRSLYTCNELHFGHRGWTEYAFSPLKCEFSYKMEIIAMRTSHYGKPKLLLDIACRKISRQNSFTQILPNERRESELPQAWKMSSILEVLERRLAALKKSSHSVLM